MEKRHVGFGRNGSRRWAVPVLVAAMVVLLASCGQSDEPETGGAANAPDPGLGHVHGLGVEPGTGNLYAASHYGVFRLPVGGKPERIADRRQDTMGFTIVDQGHFLGSGHPAPEETDKPDHLGLIESTDGAQTWESVSLAGEVDFHALVAKHDRVYGYDSQSQQMMVSTDRKNWDRRANLALADFAVHPEDPKELLATTQEGLARSTDGGRTFTPVNGAPLVLLVDWSAQQSVIAVDPDGGVRSSNDSGVTWTQRGQVPGAPQAIATNGATDVYIATESGIHVSQDGGRTFSLR